MIVADTRLPLQLTSLRKRKGTSTTCSLLHRHPQETTINNKKLKTGGNGNGSDVVVDRVAMLKLKYFDIFSKAQNYIHEHEDEEAVARRKRAQVEDNFRAIEQLEDLPGCSFRFVIDPKISEDGDDGRGTMCAFQGSQYWNPLEKILGLTIKDHQDKLERGLQVTKTLQQNPHHQYEKEEEYKAHSRSRRLLQLESQRLAARLELHKIENNADIQDNFRCFKQL
ncbi:hypothetical protein WN943_001218 [Citrus x changshan-huyou]